MNRRSLGALALVLLLALVAGVIAAIPKNPARKRTPVPRVRRVCPPVPPPMVPNFGTSGATLG